MDWWLGRWSFNLKVGGSSTVVVSLPLFTQVYKWVPAVNMLGWGDGGGGGG